MCNKMLFPRWYGSIFLIELHIFINGKRKCNENMYSSGGWLYPKIAPLSTLFYIFLFINPTSKLVTKNIFHLKELLAFYKFSRETSFSVYSADYRIENGNFLTEKKNIEQREKIRESFFEKWRKKRNFLFW